jgi:hypothetical protein
MAQHLAIRNAIRAREPESARLAAQTHIDFVRQRLDEAADSEQRQQRSLRHFSYVKSRKRLTKLSSPLAPRGAVMLS